jgi:hypothetical protein
MARMYAIDKIRRARDFVYNLGKTIKSVAVKAMLSSESWVPTIVRIYIIFPYWLLTVTLECICRKVRTVRI